MPAYTPEEQKAIDVISSYETAVNAGDAAATAALYAPDAAFFPFDFPTAKGKEAILGSYNAFFDVLTLNIKFTIDEVIVSGDLATVCSHSEGTRYLKGPDTTIPEINREVFVLTKIDGEFKIQNYMFNKPGQITE
mmetsp:Transcript_5237/g.10772  ORF Transcript_5237/g.10772 Transcript_5237/m.10772 type:complete len:135 (-) Transcript_5237:47-451(-)|eukprot:CAMPEP_0168765118 /NCGR_PEP_ID=MMETSP0725-20121227/157_1 /TAXON_ID=265536 /ORGANISM="Amphiprora sp., Strain CCMP467" /LENGTH=134 /DNA_ID=CAMNT_0008814357 /DNA_START=89 /DNA_END=493 /DNA_ORIENTATION=-